jgi:hypothetical protein
MVAACHRRLPGPGLVGCWFSDPFSQTVRSNVGAGWANRT